jgi:hypothetical protein
MKLLYLLTLVTLALALPVGVDSKHVEVDKGNR